MDPNIIESSIISLLLECSDILKNWISALKADDAFSPVSQKLYIEKLQKCADYLKFKKNEPLNLGEVLIEQGLADQKAIDLAVEMQEKHRAKKLGEFLIENGDVSSNDIDQALNLQKQRNDSAKLPSFLKVDFDRVVAVNELVGELVVIKSQLLDHDNKKHTDWGLISHLHTLLDRTVRELYDRTLSMQMMSLHQPFLKLDRCVRDTALKVGKMVNLVTIGEETELDRHIIEKIQDPLMHLCRNAIDHGLETTEERLRSGKSKEGSLKIEAYRSGSGVILELEDDGQGIKIDRIKEKLLKNGMTREEVDRLDEQSLISEIFTPSFSTTDKITDISGRGVGLDIVKAAVESLKGSVSVTTKSGRGTVFKLELPVSTSITDGVVIGAGKENYIVPLNMIKDFVTVKEGRITEMEGRMVFELRGNFYHVDYLTDKLRKKSSGCENLVVLVHGNFGTTGLLVDEIIEQNQVVLKSINGLMDASEGISGAAILGNGKVALVLDVANLIA